MAGCTKQGKHKKEQQRKQTKAAKVNKWGKLITTVRGFARMKRRAKWMEKIDNNYINPSRISFQRFEEGKM